MSIDRLSAHCRRQPTTNSKLKRNNRPGRCHDFCRDCGQNTIDCATSCARSTAPFAGGLATVEQVVQRTADNWTGAVRHLAWAGALLGSVAVCAWHDWTPFTLRLKTEAIGSPAAGTQVFSPDDTRR